MSKKTPAKKILFLRNNESGILAELFLVNAVASIITIRVFLALTGYPTISTGTVHIAHLVWGGLLLLISISLLLFFLDRFPHYLGAIIGGLGFGTFIDELGKFITADNNYFFKPTFAIIYLIFIAIFFVFRYLSEFDKPTKAEYFGNALELLKEAAVGDFDSAEKKHYLNYLKKARLQSPVFNKLSTLPHFIRSSKVAKPNLYVRAKKSLSGIYENLFLKKWFISLLILVFLGRGLVGFITVLDFLPYQNLGFFDWGFFYSFGITTLLLLSGITRIRKSYTSALQYFKYSVLSSILIYQFFAFYHQQLLALVGVVIDLAVLYALSFMMDRNS